MTLLPPAPPGRCQSVRRLAVERKAACALEAEQPDGRFAATAGVHTGRVAR
jgi:hypothetical protein